MADYTCYDLALAGFFLPSDHLGCTEAIEKQRLDETKQGDRMFWCSFAEDYYGGNADLAVEDIQKSRQEK